MTNETDRIQNAIRHIQSSLDVDPWARDIAVEAMQKQIPKPAKRKNRTLIEYCASCERALDSDDYFCWWCGQRIER